MANRGRPRSPELLTPREQDVLALVREARSNAEIGERLGISVETVKQHVSEILSKLGVETREQAAAWRPEPEERRWTVGRWAVAGLGGAIVVATVVALGLLAWGVWRSGDGADESDAADSGAGPTDEPTEDAGGLVVENPEEVQLVFIRGQRADDQPASLWVSNLDGSDARPIIEEPLLTHYIGVAPNVLTGNPAVFYATVGELPSPDGTGLTLREKIVWMREFETGETREVATHMGYFSELPTEDISADGKYLAFANANGIRLWDLSAGDVIKPPITVCPRNQSGSQDCGLYAKVALSDDGSTLAAEARTGEGTTLIFDPASENPHAVVLAGPFLGGIASDRVCTYGTGQLSSAEVYISREPDWTPITFLHNFQSQFLRPPELETSVYGSRILSQCVWLDDQTVVSTIETFIDISDRDQEIVLVDTETGEIRSLGEEPEANIAPSLVPVPSRRLLLTYYRLYDEYPDPSAEKIRPQLIDPQTNARLEILEPGDRIVDVIADPFRDEPNASRTFDDGTVLYLPSEAESDWISSPEAVTAAGIEVVSSLGDLTAQADSASALIIDRTWWDEVDGGWLKEQADGGKVIVGGRVDIGDLLEPLGHVASQAWGEYEPNRNFYSMHSQCRSPAGGGTGDSQDYLDRDADAQFRLMLSRLQGHIESVAECGADTR